MVDISGLDRADVLRALYAGARAQGMGLLQYEPEPMTREDAQKYVDDWEYFDYVRGRVLKVRLDKEKSEFDPQLYDRDNGLGAAQAAVDTLLE